ncbi:MULTISPECIES: hypothetical protein [unclassified Streptomyces]|uniref:hypothetical protein n=1 Tax=unclassified Streptomyces TaxID=2593676 RepID=UPI0022581EF8|nr:MULTISPECIES: hypothetical protein [unclassified Streptomyces]MCX4626232.1 hypothetical protein [Streptomyces sp. NBC_01443]
MNSNHEAAVHRLVVSADIKGSGQLDQHAKLRSRRAMYRVFEAAFDAIGVPVGQVHVEDRGDGVLAALDPAVPPGALVGVWLEEVHQGLREHNRGRLEPLRLRVAMHSGPVSDDGRGLVGRTVDLACRLCDSEPAREVLAADETIGLVFVVSDVLFRTVVAEGGRFVEPECYAPHPVRFKETDEAAWFHVPRRARPPLPEPGRLRQDGGGTDGTGAGERGEGDRQQGGDRRAGERRTEDQRAGDRRTGERRAGERRAGDRRTGERRNGAQPGLPPAKYAITVHGPNQIVDGAEVHGNITGVTLTRDEAGGAERGGGDE